ncbi:unnamed protein product [Ixodes hexagonus]
MVGKGSAVGKLVDLDEAPYCGDLDPNPLARFVCLSPLPELPRLHLRRDRSRDISPAPSLKLPMMMIAVGFHAALRYCSRPCVRLPVHEKSGIVFAVVFPRFLV